MKHPTAAIEMQNFQRDPSFKSRVSPGSDARRTLINHFDQCGGGRTIGLLANFLDAQGKTESIDAFLQRMLHSYQDINENEFMVSEKDPCSIHSIELKQQVIGGASQH
jgi:hypothetical protein